MILTHEHQIKFIQLLEFYKTNRNKNYDRILNILLEPIFKIIFVI